MHKEMEGYFTVEAAMVMPVILGTILLIIYLLFFQYDRCLMEQDIGVLALRGSMLQTENNEERIVMLREQADALYKEKYVAWNCGEIELKLKKGVLQVEQSGELKFPFGGNLWKGESVWTASASYENRVLSPVSFIRYYRKLVGGEK